MWILVSAVVTASFLGSLHCVGMCGPLAIWAAGADQRHGNRTLRLPVALYHLGRMITYALAGMLAGIVGQLLDLGGSAMGIQLLAARLVGSLMIGIGVLALYRTTAAWLRRTGYFQRRLSWMQSRDSQSQLPVSGTADTDYKAPQPSWLTAQFIRLRPLVFSLPLPARGLVTGLLTALLPCGWLYLFALLAASTGSAWTGAVVMLAFWLGSVPALVAVVAGTRLLATPLRSVVPVAASILLVIAGLHTASGRGFAELGKVTLVSEDLAEHLRTRRQSNTLDAQQVQADIQRLVSTPLPCCQEKTAPISPETNAPGLSRPSEKP